MTSYHHAARLGMGAVMGSKNVKAVAVSGTKRSCLREACAPFHVLLKWLKKAGRRGWAGAVGPLGQHARTLYKTTEGVKNKQLGWDPVCDLSISSHTGTGAKLWSMTLYLSTWGCKFHYLRKETSLAPTSANAARYMEDDGTQCPQPRLRCPDLSLDLRRYAGIDSEDRIGVVAWMMECYDRGL